MFKRAQNFFIIIDVIFSEDESIDTVTAALDENESMYKWSFLQFFYKHTCISFVIELINIDIHKM